VARIILNPVELKEMLGGPAGPVYRDLTTRCIRVTAAAKRGCPSVTGRLRNSIRYEIRIESGKPVGYVGSDVNYAAAVHDGTKAHDILPVNGKFLVFKGADGSQVFVTAVHHPGTEAQPFLRNAIRTAL
jgi:hypothetical protein